VAAIDAIFSRAARLGRRDVGDAFAAARFQLEAEVFQA